MEKTKENGGQQMANVVERNINALIKRRKEEAAKRTFQNKIVYAITSFAGSMLSVYLHFIFFGGWIIWNTGWLHLKSFDPSFIILATFAAVEAIFLTTFVLMSQNQMRIQEDKRAELDLQVSLLTEHEVTHILTLVTAMAKKMGLAGIIDTEIEELSKDIQPEKVMDSMENAIEGKT